MRTLRNLSPDRLAIVCALPVGAALGACAWVLFGASPAVANRLQDDQQALASAKLDRPSAPPVGDFMALIGSRPIFQIPTGPADLQQVKILLEGVALSPRRSMALVSINGAPDQWLERNKFMNGVTLVEIDSDHAVAETSAGQERLVLGQASARPNLSQPATLATPAPSPQPTPPAPRVSLIAPSPIPPGVRLPPQPASAPRRGP